jgi:hypothetical protein
MRKRELGMAKRLPLVPAAHSSAPIPTVKPVLTVIIGHFIRDITSNTAREGLLIAPGTLKYIVTASVSL